MDHADNEKVIFDFSAPANVGFQVKQVSGYTWRDWREMTKQEKREAYTEFVFDCLGVEISAVGDES